MKSPKILLNLFVLLGLGAIALFANELSPHDYDAVSMGPLLSPPNSEFWMGTDVLGRDLMARVFHGARMSLSVGLCTAIFSLVLGTLTGLIAGYFGGKWDRILMTLVDWVNIFPMLLLAILLTLLVGRGFFGIFLAIGMTSWVSQARLVRGLVLQVRELPYIESCHAMGIRTPRILIRHILPNLWGPILVSLTFQIPNNILTESFLSFVGLGIQPPLTSWGTLANEGFRGLQSNPHLMIFPGFALFITMIAFQFLGDGLRDHLDPKSKLGSGVGS